MPTITSFDGCRINVTVEGPENGFPVVLSHYLGGASGTFEGQAAILRETRRVITFDTRGHGASDAPPGDYSVEMLGQDALAVLDALNVGQADFVGVSQGGMTGMWMAANHPDRIRRLVLANTTPFIPNKPVWDQLAARAAEEGLDGIATETISGWLCDETKAKHPELVGALISHMAGMPVSGYVGNTRVLRDVDLRDRLGDIAAPTLVIGGAEDGPRGASAPVVANAVQEGRLEIVPAAAHLSHLENREAFNIAIAEHLGV